MVKKYQGIEGENLPIGLILCTSKNQENIELLQLEEYNIKIAEYLTQLPDMKLFEQRLHQAIEMAKNKMSSHAEDESSGR